jgi:hypothetical protein
MIPFGINLPKTLTALISIWVFGIFACSLDCYLYLKCLTPTESQHLSALSPSSSTSFISRIKKCSYSTGKKTMRLKVPMSCLEELGLSQNI